MFIRKKKWQLSSPINYRLSSNTEKARIRFKLLKFYLFHVIGIVGISLWHMRLLSLRDCDA